LAIYHVINGKQTVQQKIRVKPILISSKNEMENGWNKKKEVNE
jgi:hypothetical protein